MKKTSYLGALLGISMLSLALCPSAEAQTNIITYPTANDTGSTRLVHNLFQVPDGRVIIQGAPVPASPAGNIIEAYDPATRTFQTISSNSIPLWGNAAAMLPDGRILLAGGFTNTSFSMPVSTAEIFDPVTATYQPVGDLNIGRGNTRGITLQDGRVLITSGNAIGVPGITKTSEIFNPTTQTFTLAGDSIASHSASFGASSQTLLQDGRVLFVGASSSASVPAEIFDPSTETFHATGLMTLSRAYHTATLLPNGKVVIIGGIPTGTTPTPTTLVELFDPVTESFSVLGNINVGRREHTADLLPDGRILVTGGGVIGTNGGLVYDNGIEIFDPATGTSETIGTMAAGRMDHRTCAFADGSILITGGRVSPPSESRSAEIFDFLFYYRPEDLYAFYHSLDLLTAENQQLLDAYNNATNVIWGLSVTNSNLQGELTYANETINELQTQLDEIQPNPFRLLPTSVPPRPRINTFTLDDGRVLMLGGITLESPSTRSVSVYDPRTEGITTAGGINEARVGHTANLLENGRILCAGGSIRSLATGAVVVTNTTEIYNLSTSNSVPGPSMIYPRISAGSVNLTDGRILILGGRNNSTSFVAQSEIYEPTNQAFRLSGIMPQAVSIPTVTRLLDGRVLVYGSTTNTAPVIQIFDPATETFHSLVGPATGRIGHQATLLADGKVFISGGRAAITGQILNTTEIFDPSTGTFSSGPNMLLGRQNAAATLLPDGTVLITGGQTNNTPYLPATVQAEIFNPAEGTFSSAGVMATNQYFHNGVLLENGTVLLTGGSTGVGPGLLLKSQLYDPIKHVFTSEFNGLNLLINDLATENTNLNNQLSVTQQQLANATNVIWGLTMTNTQLQQELAVCQSNETYLELQITGLTNQIGQLQGTVTTLTTQNNALTNQVAQLQAQVNTLLAQNSTLSNQVVTLTQEKAALQTQLSNTQGQLQVLIDAYQAEFSDPTFTIAGGSLEQQVQNLVSAILDLNHGQRQALYFNLQAQ